MRIILYLYIFGSFFVPCFAQINDDFSDKDLSANPTWGGDIDSFIVNEAEQLQLNASASGTAAIHTTVSFEGQMEWSFFFKMDFNPSTANRLSVYLQASSTNLANSSGYFLEIGETGSEDALKLYRQDEGVPTLLLTGTTGKVATEPIVRVSVKRQLDGEWELTADYEGGSSFSIEGKVTDTTYGSAEAAFFGFLCKYTATRSNGFIFDDVMITNDLEVTNEDEIAPQLVAVEVIDATSVALTFDESIREETLLNEENFSINNGIGFPASVEIVGPEQAVLNLSAPLQEATIYTLSIGNVADLSGNELSNFDTTFQFNPIDLAKPYDILMTEIMEDATLTGGSTLGLPNHEYVELYNRSDKILNLEGFTFSDGGSRAAVFPDYILAPKAYLIIARTNATVLNTFGDFLGLPNFPALAQEETLVLKDDLGNIVDVVAYNQDWYGSTTLAGGSVALERINVNAPCLGIINWKGSSSFLGGTPGAENTVNDTEANLSIPPSLVNAYPLDASTVRLTFDQAMDLNSLMDLGKYSITNHDIENVQLIEDNLTDILLELNDELVINQIETIQIQSDFANCNGQSIAQNNNLPVALPALPQANDLVLNEILFNPQVGGKDYVEFYNRSEKVVDLNGLFLANQVLDNPQFKPIEIEQLIFPKEYIVLTENVSDIKSRYAVENPLRIFEQDLPTFPDQSGNVLLYINDGTSTVFLDEFDYSDDLHNGLLNDKNGVALERISTELPTQNAGNWQSAALDAGFGTPTAVNSQQATPSSSNSSIFSLSNKRISPDNDGFENFIQVNYRTDQSGYIATIQIFDAQGKLIKNIAQSDLLGTEGSFKWEGLDAEGQRVPKGIYVLWIEYFDLSGTKRQEKKAIVVAEKL
ncbi:MAG: lamin tail domain-containing protein [Bacteroidota bacterium]